MVVWQEAELAVKRQWCRQAVLSIKYEICEIHYSRHENSPYHHNWGIWDIWCYIKTCLSNRNYANTNTVMFDVLLFRLL